MTLIRCYLLFILVLLGRQITYGQETVSSLSISSDFPGGSVLMEQIDADTVWLAPDTRKIKGDWFYWYFSAKSNIDKEVYFILPKSKIPSFGPAISLDAGENWKWMYNREHRGLTSFKYLLKAGKEVRFSMGFPYTKVNFKRFINDYRSHPYVKLDTLCTSRAGTEVPMLFIRNPKSADNKKKIVITARHHACEMIANYVLEGFITQLVDGKGNSWLKDNFEFLIIPFVDMDGVQNGDQGKNRTPRDHNQDYSGESIYETTNAIRSFIPQWSQNDLEIALDLHCPYISGKGHEVIYLVGSSDSKFAREEEHFARVLSENTSSSVLKFGESGLVSFGTSWNTGKSRLIGDTFKLWVQKQFPNTKLATTVEIPYANNKGQQITQENLKLFGEDMVKSLEEYLQFKFD